MALITATQLRQHIETDLTDTAIDRIIDAADSEIIARLGALASDTDVLEEGGRNKILHLRRKASSITSIVERILRTDYALGSDDYSLLGDGYRVERLQGSTQPFTHWRGRVTVVYAPSDETNQRTLLEIDLCKLSIQYNALRSESGSGLRAEHLDHQEEREKLFSRLLKQNRRLLA